MVTSGRVNHRCARCLGTGHYGERAGRCSKSYGRGGKTEGQGEAGQDLHFFFCL